MTKDNMLTIVKSFLPSPLREWLRWRRLLANCGDYSRKDLEAVFQDICTQVDINRIRTLHDRFSAIIKQDPQGAAKYLDHNYWLRVNIIRAVRMHLHKAPPSRVLDLGCGPGYFMAVCRHFGHEVLGVDAPNSFMTDIEKEIYSEMLDALNCHKLEELVKPYVPLSLKGTFDFITGFMICFNNHMREDEWTKDEWTFFIDDATGHLRDKGVLCLELNSHSARYPELLYYDQDTLSYFKSVGEVSGPNIRIAK